MKLFQGADLCTRYLFVSIFSFTIVSRGEALLELYDRFYKTLNDSLPCFRLTNGDRQIGCSGSDTNTRGVVHYVENQENVEWLIHNSPHPPYIALMEPALFTSYNVPRLRDSSRVNGILLRYDDSHSHPADIDYFSAERKCPNRDFGTDDYCTDENPWNIYTNGTSLSFSDFGDFPIFAVPSYTFDPVHECFKAHNANGSGGIIDYPLCAAEMVADMLNAKSTESCFRRGNLLTLVVNGVELCDPLGDKTVWGSIFELNETRINKGAIMLATKLDSIAFFPYLSWGANNELAGIATLMAVLQTIGNLKKSGDLIGTERPILYSFFHGESWDYIGSSRMIYDMENDDFPYFDLKFSHDSITDYLELTNLGLFDTQQPTTYYHNQTLSSLLARMISIVSDTNTNMSLAPTSTRKDLPVASLQRFLLRNPEFSGAVLSDFNTTFTSKFYGSRYDNMGIFSNLLLVAEQLASLATIITQAVLDESMPVWKDGTNSTVKADQDTIENILLCFLNSTNCELFHSVLTYDQAKELEDEPLQRYVSVDTTTNSETIITYALVAEFTGVRVNPSGNPNTPFPCSECSDYANELSKNDSQVTVVKQQSMNDSDTCYCVLSYVHYHTAVSPAFVMDDYTSKTYSTWAESRWRFINLRIYVVTYPLQEVAFFFCGLAMIFITLLFAVQGSRKRDKIFNTLSVVHTPLRLTTADRRTQPEPIDISDSEFESSPDIRDSSGATNIQ